MATGKFIWARSMYRRDMATKVDEEIRQHIYHFCILGMLECSWLIVYCFATIFHGSSRSQIEVRNIPAIQMKFDLVM